MSTTTSIRLDEELKERIASAAQRSGKTPNAFIVDAITETVEQAELQADFDRVSDERWGEIARTGKTVPLADADAYLAARARGERPARPRSRPSTILARAIRTAGTALPKKAGSKARR
jgi:predicted transcriptional regulator